jgi:hypothetical protein
LPTLGTFTSCTTRTSRLGNQTLKLEEYDFDRMIRTRKEQIYKNPLGSKLSVGVILGVLGRQGSVHILNVD